MSSFHDVQFPTNISYGSRGGPGFNTTIIETETGAEHRIARWSGPRHRYDVSYGIKSLADLALVKEFFMARLGAAYGFRYKDWGDFTSKQDGVSAPSNIDVQIAVGDGSTTTFNLIKKYTSGGFEQLRRIYKPIDSSVTVALDGVNQSSGWSVNATVGRITFSSAPALNEVITVGFEFDVPVRFGKEVDEWLAMSYDDFSNGSIPSIPLIEVADIEPANTDYFVGGAEEVCIISGDYQISAANARTIGFQAMTTGLNVLLPNPASMATGGPHFFIQNIGSNTFTLKTHTGTTLLTIASGNGVVCLIGLNSSSTKIWIIT